MIFQGRALRLKDDDITRAGALIGVGEDEIHAVIEVEAAGGGFDGRGRLKMLFEPHKFWAELGPGAKRDQAAKEGLAYAKWGARPYPKDSYPRLIAAMEIDEVAALRSASWGMGQIMGFNAGVCGFATVRAMVIAFADSEGAQLDAMVRFIKSKGLDAALRRHDWAAFARGYNGAGYAKNAYDVKLARAYAKWAKIPDTPPSPKPVAASPAANPDTKGFWASLITALMGIIRGK